jgi:hypothetical protein
MAALAPKALFIARVSYCKELQAIKYASLIEQMKERMPQYIVKYGPTEVDYIPHVRSSVLHPRRRVVLDPLSLYAVTCINNGVVPVIILLGACAVTTNSDVWLDIFGQFLEKVRLHIQLPLLAPIH